MANFDDATLKSLGENGRRKMVEKFDEKLVFNKYLKVLSYLQPGIHT
jgi:hypothetical protein